MTHLLQWSGGLASTVGLLIDLVILPNLQLQFFRKGVDAGNTDPTQADGNFVTNAVELSAGVQLRHHHFSSGFLLAFVVVHRDPTPIVDNRDGVVVMNSDVYARAIAG